VICCEPQHALGCRRGILGRKQQTIPGFTVIQVISKFISGLRSLNIFLTITFLCCIVNQSARLRRLYFLLASGKFKKFLPELKRT
jgi:hypothetical protein